MKKWSEADTIKFVKLYCDFDCLWNVTIPEYKNHLQRTEAWQTVVAAMDMEDFTLGEARNKVKSLRNTYNQELRKMKNHQYYKPAIKWFDVMHQTLGKIKPEHRTDLLCMRSHPQSFDSEQEIFGYVPDEEIYINDDTAEETSSELPSTTTTLSFLRTEEVWPTAPLRKKRRQDFGDNPEQCLNRFRTHAEEDEFDAFGTYMAHGLKNMSIHLALECQKELQGTLTRFRLMSLSAQPPSSSSDGRDGDTSGVGASNMRDTSVAQYAYIKTEDVDEQPL